MRSNYGRQQQQQQQPSPQQYSLLSPAASAAPNLPRQQHQHHHQQQRRQQQELHQMQANTANNLAGGLPMANGRIQQQIATAGNYPMASNKLDSPSPAQLAPADSHYANSGFKAALRHPQKFIHNLYSNSTGRNQTKSLSPAEPHKRPQQQPSPAQTQQHLQPQVSRFPGEAPNDAQEPRQDQYASQLRRSPLLHRFQQQQQQQLCPAGPAASQPLMQQKPAGSSGRPPVAESRASPPKATTSATPLQQQGASSPLRSPAERSPQVNFNRGSGPPDAEEGESRKKKYLTAKYGQQQMNLIKKRLKIEMWLYEQLQELAKSTKSEAELEEVEIDLDQLLDMDDDDTRRRWLKKTLEPFEDLQPERIDKFIDDVLDQSKLL